MKILIANKYLYAKAGAETVMFQERDYLVRNGVQVIDFSMLDKKNVPSNYSKYFVSHKEYRLGTRIERLRSALSFIYSQEAVRKISHLIEDTKPDILHCHNVYHQLTPSIINAAKSRGIPVVLTVHDLKTVCPTLTAMRQGKPCSLCRGREFHHVLRHRCAGGLKSHSALLYAEAVIQRWLGSYENVDRIIAPSLYMRERLLDRFPSDRISLLYNGVDACNIQSTVQDRGYVLYSGRLAAGKGIETLLQAHHICGHAWPIVIAGTGPLKDILSSRKTPNVRFTGHLAGGDLINLVSKATLVVVPPIAPENCPMSVLEAMAHGKPVIGSRNGGIPELIDNGITGLLFDIDDSVQLARYVDTLMSDDALRQRMGNQARLRAETQFSLQQHNVELMKIYDSVLAN